MTDRYVGPGGNDGADGLSWANRKETLNGVEDTPVVAGDTIYVGAGTYREALTVDVDGSGGNIITYIADVTGENTDAVGGLVRVTGLNSDEETVDRSNCLITTAARDYRTFRGFEFDGWGTYCLSLDGSGLNNWILEDINFAPPGTRVSSRILNIAAFTASGDTFTIRRCCFSSVQDTGIYVNSSGSDRQFNLLIENCIVGGCDQDGIRLNNVYDVVIKNCTLARNQEALSTRAIAVDMISSANKVYVYNCVLMNNIIEAINPDCVVEDYNALVPYGPTKAGYLRGITIPGANSDETMVNFVPPTIIPGFVFPQSWYEPVFWSNLIGLECAQSPPSEDFFGMIRPSVDAKKTRGAIQLSNPERETTTVPSGETESLKFADAMSYQIFVPITGKTMRFEVKVNREADYAGTLPQMIIKQPGQSDRITTDTGSVSTWNTLSDQFTPAGSPAFVVLEVRSNNTALSGSYGTYFGAFEVK